MSSCSLEVPVYGVPINLNELKHKVYYAEVAVGNTLYVSHEYGMMCEPPSGYDSFLVCSGLNNHDNKDSGYSEDKSEYRNDHKSRNKEEYKHDYKDSKGKLYDENKDHMHSNYHKNKSYAKQDDSITLEYLNDGHKRHTQKADIDEDPLKRSLRNIDSKYTSSKNKTKTIYQNETVNDDNQSVHSNTSRSTNLSSTIITEENINFETLFYLIKDPSKINILHEVHFDYDQGLENGKGNCEKCKSYPSIMFCLAERASFCKKCDDEIHNNEFTQRHQMFYYDSLKKKKQFLQCPFHAENVSDYFCEECMILLCSVCKISGSHADPPFSNHKLVKFLEACDEISGKMKDEEKDLENKIKIFEEEIKIFTSAVSSEFLTNINQIRVKIENEYRSAMNELNSIVRKKYQIINAKFIEQRVCLERCIRMKKYIEEIDEGQSVKDYKAIQEQKTEMKTKEIKPHVGNEKVIMKGYISIFSENDREAIKREIYTENKRR